MTGFGLPILGIVLLLRKVEGIALDDTKCYVENTPGKVFLTTGAYTPNELTREMCQEACADLDDPPSEAAGVTSGNVCLCGALDTNNIDGFLVEVGADLCNMTCPGEIAMTCGGQFGRFNVLSAGISGLSTFSFDLTSDTDPDTSWEEWTLNVVNLTFGEPDIQAYVFVQLGLNSMPTLATPALSDVANIDFNPYLNFGQLAPRIGRNVLLVTAMDESGKTTFSRALAFDFHPPLEPLQVNCPPVAEPNVSFSCSFGVHGAEENPPDAKISYQSASGGDPGPIVNLKGIHSNYHYFGHQPPIGGQHTLLTPSDLSSPVILSNSRVDAVTYIVWVYHAKSQGDVTIQAAQPECSTGSYNPFTGFCEPSEDWGEVEENHILGLDHSCSSPGVFNSMFKMCSPESCAAQGQCKASPTRPTSFNPMGPTASLENGATFTKLSEPLILSPGQYLAIKSGSPLTMSATQNADLLSTDGSELGTIHFVQGVGVEPNFIDVEYTCTIHNDTIMATLSMGVSQIDNTTKCHDPIEGFAVAFNTTATTQLPAWSPTMYVATDESIDLTVTNTRGNPVHNFVDWMDGFASVVVDLELMGDARSFDYSHEYRLNGTYNVNVSSWNLHSELIYGHVKYVHNATQEIIVQKKVEDFEVKADDFWIRDVGAYMFGLEYPLLTDGQFPLLPTDPNMICTWDDNRDPSPNDEFVDFANMLKSNDTSLRLFFAPYDYDDHGEYNVTCFMYNKVSNQTLEKFVTIYNRIMNFTATALWVPNGMDEHVDEPLEPLGPDKNQLPLDRNVTFVFDYVQGTIEVLNFWNKTEGNETFLGSFNVTDKFNARDFRVNIPFREEGSYNVTVSAQNEREESEEVLLSFEIVGQVRGLVIDDFEEVTSKDELKWLFFDFESIGAGTCIYVDFKDGIEQTFGDATYCASWMPDIEYVPGVDLINPVEITHVYYQYGMYNVSAWASNIVTEVPVFDDLMVIITSAPCRPPDVSIPKNSTSNLAPLEYYRSETIAVSSLATLNCSDLVSTRKKWEIYKADVNIVTGEEFLTLVDILSVAPTSFDMAELIIPPRTLEYGTYKLRFYSRMWDDSDQDPLWTRKMPFERDAFSYIAIKPTPLVAGLVKGAVSFVTRGSPQFLTLSPHLYTFDPDYPEDKDLGMEFRFFCRQYVTEALEAYPMNANRTGPLWGKGVPVPTQKQEDVSGGCFGSGPNSLTGTESPLSIPGRVFIRENQTYEFRLEVRKDVRMSFTRLLVFISPGLPPVMEIQCADPALCFLDDVGQLYVNPTTRLALKSECYIGDGSNCQKPMTFEWEAFDGNETIIAKSVMNPLYVSGNAAIEMAVKTQFFSLGGITDRFVVGINAINGMGATGISRAFLRVNQPPKGGQCSVSPVYGLSLVDSFTIVCSDWVDPEGKDIAHYTIYVKDDAGSIKPLLKVKEFNPIQPKTLQLGIGIHTIVVEVVDQWGAKNMYECPEKITVDSPGPDDISSLFDPNVLAEMNGKGDINTMLMFLQARGKVLEDAEDTIIKEESLLPVKPKSEKEKAYALAEQKGELKIDSMETLIKATGVTVTDMATAEIMASTIAAIVGGPADEGQFSDIGIELTQKTTKAVKLLMEKVEELPVSDPDSLTRTIESVMAAMGILLSETQKTSKLNNDYDSSNTLGEDGEGADMCEGVSPIDQKSATKPGALDYETYIDDLEMTVPSDPGQQLCGGAVDAARAQEEETGEAVMDIMKKSALKILKTLVLNEERIIEKGPITIYTKMIPGPNLSDWHVVGYDAERDPKYSFTKNFCLGQLVEGMCQTPAGVAAISYDVNPLCNVQTCDRLAPDTKILDMHMTNRDLVDVKVSKVYDGESKEGIFLDIPRLNDTRLPLTNATFWDAYHESSVSRFKAITFKVMVAKADSSLTIEYFPVDPTDPNVTLFLDFERLPTLKNYSMAVTVKHLEWNSEGEFFSWYLDDAKIGNRTGRWFLMAMNFTEEINATELSLAKAVSREGSTKFETSFNLRTWTSGCYFYDKKLRAWVADGVSIREALYPATFCRSSHLTAFGAGFFVVPQTLDFEFVFAEASFEDNATIYIALLLTLFLYLIMLAWSKYNDMQDEKRLRSRPLVDNNPKDHYLYEILTFTGQWRESSCDSLVQMILTGDDEETTVRTLDPGWKDTLRKGCVDSYIMRTPRPLGDLQYVRAWHDNTGRGNYASWYCTAFVIRDVQTNQQWEFLCNRWLAVEKGDGQIQRLIPVSGEEDQSNFDHVMTYTTERGIREHHVWFSVFMRNARFRFTRAQRVTTGFAMLYLGMFLNAAWYYITPEKPIEGWRIGVVVLSWDQLWVGFVCNLITLPAILLVILLFRKSRRRVLRPNRVNLALADEDDNDNPEPQADSSNLDSGNESDDQGPSGSRPLSGVSVKSAKDDDEEVPSGSRPVSGTSVKSSKGDSPSASRPASGISIKTQAEESGSHENDAGDDDTEKIDVDQPIESRPSTSKSVVEAKAVSLEENDEYQSYEARFYKPKRKFYIHWIFKYVAWVLCLGMILLGIVYLWALAITMGNDRTYQWLSSMLITFFLSIVLIDPLKIVLITLFATCISRNVNLDDDDVDEDEEAVQVADQSLWYRKGKKSRTHELYPIDEVFLERVRKHRIKEVEMWAVVRELAAYAFFILIIYIISYGNRDTNSFRMQQVLQNNFITKNGFETIVSSNEWWEWAHTTVVEELRAQAYYNDQPPYGLRGFIGDKVHRIMGYGILRQVRVMPNSCRVDKRIFNITQECAQASAFINEDHSDYCNAWAESNALTVNLPSCQKKEFKYVTANELDSLPYNAGMDLYGGGGYVYRLNKPNAKIKEELLELQQQHWVNNHTRAIFLEFSVYNPNINLFGIGTVVAEFLPGGGIRPYWRFEIVRLLHHHESAGTFVLICEIIFVLYILYYIFGQLMLMKKFGKRYFTTYWTLADWSIILCAFIAVFFYVSRYLLTNEILTTFRETNGNGYMKLQYVGVIDELYGYSIGLILFVATINFIKLLRFNNRFAMLLLTLRACWDDLTGFFTVFFLVFFAFVQVFFMILHSYMLEFHSIVAALETCFTMLLNKFKFGSIRETSLTAAVMFFCFAISCSFILINVMLTIIMEAYQEVRSQLEEAGNKYDIVDFLFSKTAQFIGTEPLPPKESALTRDRQEAPTNEETSDEETEDGEENRNVKELPQKVELFLNYINDVYFKGELDADGKEFFKKGLGDEDEPEEEDRRVYGSDDITDYTPTSKRKIVIG